MMHSALKPLLIAAGLAGVLSAAAASAVAFPDAKIDAELKPNFRDLIYPPIRHHERFRYEGGVGYRPLHPERYAGYGRPGGVSELTVDCSDPRGGARPLSDALYYLAPGGVLHLRQGSVCADSLYIDKPVVIVGEPGSAFSEDSMRRPRIEALPGSPCVAVAPGVRVELRDIALADEQAGRNGCVEGEDADIALTRVSIDYGGARSAVDVTGGRLIVSESQIDAGRADSAILADDTAVQIAKSEIHSQLMGLDLTPSLTAPSAITDMRLIGPGNGDAVEPRTVGVMVRGGQRASGQLTIRDSFVGHWRTGLWLDAGSRVELANSRIYKSALGVLVDEAEAVISNSSIGASEVGIYAGSGRVDMDHNRIHGFRQAPVVLDRSVVSSEHDNVAYAEIEVCSGLRDWAPRCMPLESLPYELTVEGAAPSWGAEQGGDRRPPDLGPARAGRGPPPSFAGRGGDRGDAAAAGATMRAPGP